MSRFLRKRLIIDKGRDRGEFSLDEITNKKGEIKLKYLKHIVNLNTSDLNKLYNKRPIIKQQLIRNFNRIADNFDKVFLAETNRFYDRDFVEKRADKYNVGEITDNFVILPADNFEEITNNFSTNLDKETLTLNVYRYGVENTLKFLRKLQDEKSDTFKYIIEFGGNIFTLTHDFISRIDNIILQEEKDESGSDVKTYNHIKSKGSLLTIKRVEFDKKEEQKHGGFFEYINTTDVDLTKFGIFTEEQYNNKDFIEQYHNNNCLYHALKEGGLCVSKLERLKSLMKERNIHLNKLNKVCSELGIRIKLTTLQKRGDVRIVKYGSNGKVFELGHIENHLFINTLIPVNIFYIKNYNKLERGDFSAYEYNGKYIKRKKEFSTAFKVIKSMIENKLFEPLTQENLINFNYKNDLDLTAFNDDYLIGSYKKHTLNKNYTQKLDKNTHTVFMDTEAYNNFDTGFNHIPFIISIKKVRSDVKRSYVGLDCIEKCFGDLFNEFESGSKLICYFHNLKYDLNVILDKIRLYGDRPIIKDNNVYSYSGEMFKGKKKLKIEFRDTYKIITEGLARFGNMFNIPQQKEILPYEFYNSFAFDLNNPFVDINTFCSYLDVDNQENRERLLNNAINWDCMEDGFINSVKYCRIYCERDVEVLEKGYLQFMSSFGKIPILQDLNLTYENFLSISSISDAINTGLGVYGGVYSISGTLREFIGKSVVGGRCMLRNNKKQHAKGKIVDYDAVSLYPSAIKRLAKELGGYLMGTPKTLNNDDLNMGFLNSVDGYFVLIEFLTDAPIRRSMPLVCLNKNGSNNWTNEVKGERIVVGKIQLEDLIKFQNFTENINFKILGGVYYNEGRNNKCGEVIEALFNERLQYKKEGNNLEKVIKLLLNSAYGKTILKASSNRLSIVSEKEFEQEIKKRYNFINRIRSIGNKKFIFELKHSILNHFNRCHIGSEILAMSKRIMNEVICLAEDNELKIFYQDTDSIHLYANDLLKLKHLYEQKYNRVLDGKEMGQFHSDFQLEGCKEAYSTEFIGVGKKAYLDLLEGINGNREIVNGHHIRMKGVSECAMGGFCRDNGIDLHGLYCGLLEGSEFEIDLLGGGKKSFEAVNLLGGMRTREVFNRRIGFDGEVEVSILVD